MKSNITPILPPRKVNAYDPPWVIEVHHPEDDRDVWRRCAGYGSLPAYATCLEDGMEYLKEWTKGWTGTFRLRNTHTSDIIMGDIL